MKKIIRKLIYSRPFAGFLINRILKLHSWTYSAAGKMGKVLNNGVHPKHDINNYMEWFMNRIGTEDTILDIGSNTGKMAGLLSGKAGFVYGIEIMESLHNQALVSQSENLEFLLGDATQYDFSGCRPIDIVTLSNVLEHIEFRIDFLKKLQQQLKWNRSPHFLIRVPMIDRGWIVLYKKERGLDYRLDKTHYTEYTEKQFREEMKQAGLSIKSLEIRFGEIFAECISTG